MNLAALFALWSSSFPDLVADAGVPDRDAEDVAQDALLAAWEAREQLDPEGNPEGWGYTIARHKAWDYLRAAGRRREDLTSFEKYELLDLCPGPEDEATERRRAKLLWELLEKVDLHYRIILVLHEIEGLTLSEIAEREGLKFEAVKTRLRRAREQLDMAKARWQAEQRRKGLDGMPCVPLWLGPDVRSWWDTALRDGVAAPLAQAAGILLFGLVVSAHQRWRSPWPPLQPALSVVAMAAVGPTNSTARDGRAETDASTAVESFAVSIGAKPSLSRPRKGVLPAADATARRAAAHAPLDDAAPSAEEASLIHRARVAIEAHTATGDMTARQLLERHARECPEGRLAAERESLRRRVQ